MRVSKISVSGLFGVFDHVIPLNLDARITIVHGPNGYGKTIVLGMVDGLLRGNYGVLRTVPFGTFEVEFDDAHAFRVTKTSLGEQKELFGRARAAGRRSRSKLECTLIAPGSEPKVISLNDRSIRDRRDSPLVNAIDALLPFLSRAAYGRWRTDTGELLYLDEVLERYGDLLPPGFEELRDRREASEIEAMRRNLHVRLIRTQRLDTSSVQLTDTHARQESRMPTVELYSTDIVRKIQDVLAEYAARSQDLDRTFPGRLLMHDQQAPLSGDELLRRFAELEGKRARLIQLGFLDSEQYLSPSPEQAVERRSDVLSVYVQDVEKKLGTFDRMAAKVGLLMEIVNSRFLYKKMTISRERGFVFTSASDSPLSPNDLSSGEQHELVLFYELLFKAESGWLVLIDEPEISLHVAWQDRFLDDLQKVVKLSGVDVVLATHSPSIIGEHWPLTVELKGPTEAS